MHRGHRQPAVEWLVAIAGLVLLTGFYVLLMRLSLDVSRLEGTTSPSDRDLYYFVLHVAVLILAGASGVLVGKWLNGLGFAFAVLFVVVIAFAMLLLQFATYAAACEGYNDLIRHWTC